jgi:hypothetical protein
MAGMKPFDLEYKYFQISLRFPAATELAFAGGTSFLLPVQERFNSVMVYSHPIASPYRSQSLLFYPDVDRPSGYLQQVRKLVWRVQWPVVCYVSHR